MSKTHKILALLFLAIFTISCGFTTGVKTAVENTDAEIKVGVDLYTDVETAVAMCSLTQFTEFSNIKIALKLNTTYINSFPAVQTAWASAFRDLDNLQADYNTAAQPNEEGHMDLGALTEQGLMPSDIAAGGLNIMVNAQTQAQAIQPGENVSLAAMDTASEGYNHINTVCGQTITTISAYNKWSHDVSNAIGLELSIILALKKWFYLIIHIGKGIFR